MLRNVLVAANDDTSGVKSIYCVTADEISALPGTMARWAKANNFSAKSGTVLLVPSPDGGEVAAVLIGAGNDPFVTGSLAKQLPKGTWRFSSFSSLDPRLATIGFLLGSYRFERYKKDSNPQPKLMIDGSLDKTDIIRQIEGAFTARDLINTPANDMGPDQIEAAARKIAKAGKATIKVIKGDDLLAKNFPMVHAVGRASAIAPRLIDMTWGDKKAPKITLVGKGVAFDTGGLNIKPASSMRNMKKDMGGAANLLGLAQMIMSAKLNMRLRVLIPAVENSISDNAFRPGDILQSRKGLTVEIGNTDAEGRLVLADALTYASEESPEMIIDMATLTGAARVALGPELPPFFTDDDEFASALTHAADEEQDPVWRLPLWQNYNKALASTCADMNNVTTDGFAGSITAALFLQRFVDPSISWTHLDIFGWNPSAKPHSPIGGEAQAIRALFAALAKRYP